MNYSGGAKESRRKTLKGASYMQYVLPENFPTHSTERTIQLNGLTVVKFRQMQESQHNELFLSTHLLHVLLKGQKRIHVGDRTLVFRSGEAVFLKQGHYVIGEIGDEELPFQNLLFFFESTLLKEFLTTYQIDPPQDGESQAIFRVHITPAIQNFINFFLPLFESAISSKQELLRLKFFELLYYLSHSPENAEFVRFLYNLKRREKSDLLEVMKTHFMAPLNIEQYARLSGRSLSTFNREFTETFGISPGKWLRQQRLKRAYFLLTHSDYSVTDVCFESGYQNLSHFIQVFKKAYGITPKQLAKNNIF
jgi:AraC-like DNA-binding protein